MNDVELPNKLSDLIELALKDLARAERDPRYTVNMGTWHNPLYSIYSKLQSCVVCFGGAIMAKTKECSISLQLRPSSFSNDDQYKLYALDSLRCYDFHMMFYNFRRAVDTGMSPKHKQIINDLEKHFGERYELPEYEDNRADFKFNMRLVISILREYKM